MDELCERNNYARRRMIEAFSRVCELARCAGVDEADLVGADGYFFAANAEARSTFGVVVLLAKVREPPHP